MIMPISQHKSPQVLVSPRGWSKATATPSHGVKDTAQTPRSRRALQHGCGELAHVGQVAHQNLGRNEDGGGAESGSTAIKQF